jgi:hypothetical protein
MYRQRGSIKRKASPRYPHAAPGHGHTQRQLGYDGFARARG